MFGKAAKQENEALSLRVNQLTQENESLRSNVAVLTQAKSELEAIIATTGAGDVHAIRQAHQQAYDEYQRFLQVSENETQEIHRSIASAKRELSEITAQLSSAQQETFLQDMGIFDFNNPAEKAIEIGDQIKAIRASYKKRVTNKTATRAIANFTFDGSAAKGKTFISQMSRMMLRAYNSEAENAVMSVKAGNLDAAIKRLERAREQSEKQGAMISFKIDTVYHYERIQELKLTSTYLVAKQVAKEMEREEKARLREEAKAAKEIQDARAALRKELEHHQNTITTLISQGRLDEAEEHKGKIAEIEEAVADVEKRAANTRAGYVYVISNIGAFGDATVKIGMTRRLEPMDRVRELSDASVPFNFDVHAMFFSEDAVGVEAELHRHFAAHRVNRVNLRREFFNVTPEQVKEKLLSTSGNLLEFQVEPNAEQYYESLKIAQLENPDSIAIAM